MGNFYSRHYGTPDLSDIYGIAKKTGRNEGYNNFMGDIVKMRVQAQIKAQQEAAKAQADKVAAAAEESSKPESESFWDKLDQFGLDIVDKQEKALSWTMDKLSRGLYGVTNAFQEAGHQAYGGEKDNLGKISNEFWKGIHGEKKQDMIQMIQSEASTDGRHNLWDNKAVQVGVGLIGDIVMDPTTYVGAGLVTKPMKAAQLMKGESKLSAIADDVEKLGVTRKLSDEEVAVSKGHHGPFTKEDYEQRVPLERSEILAMLGKAPKGRRATTGKAQQAMNARLMTEQLPRLKKLIREDPNLPTDESIARLTDEIEKIQKQRVKDLTDHEREAYEQKLAEFDRNPKLLDELDLPPVGRTSALQDYEKTRNLSQTAHAFKEEFFFRKGSKTNKSFHDVMGRGWKEDARISPEFRNSAYDQTVKLAKNDKTHQDYMRKVAVNLNQIKDLKGKIAAAKETGNTEKVAELEATLKSVTAKKDFYVDKANMEKAAIFHSLVRRHIGSLDGMSPELASEMDQLVQRGHEIRQRLQYLDEEDAIGGNLSNSLSQLNVRLTQDLENPRGTQSIEERMGQQHNDLNNPISEKEHEYGDSSNQGTVFSERRELNEELDALDKRFREIQDTENFIGKEALEKPASLGDDFEVTEKWLKTKPKDPEEAAFQSDVRKELNERAQKEEDSLMETALREKRDKSLDKVVDSRIRKMFGNKDINKGNELSATVEDRYKHPKIEVDGKDVYQADKDVLAKHVTDEDIREAARKSADTKGSNEEVYQVLNEINDIKASLRTGIDSGAKDIDVLEGQSLERKLTEANERLRQLTHTSKTTVSPEFVAFDRMFKAQYGVTRRFAMGARKEAIKDVAKATPAISKTRPTLSAADKAAVKAEAKERALKGVNEELKRGDFKVRKGQDLEFEVWDEDSFTRAAQAAMDQAKHDYAMKVATAKSELHGRELESRLNGLRQERDLKLTLHKEALDEAKKAREAMADRLDEQLILDALNDAMMPMGQKRLQITFAGKSVVGPGIASPKILTAATEKLGGLPILQRANKVWSEAFKPASKIEPELNLARLRAQANTPLIIKHHVDDIRHRFAKFKPEERRAALRGLKRGAPVGNRELYDGMREYLDELVPYLTGKVKIDGKPLDLMEINRFLDEKYRFVGKDSRYTGSLDLSSPEKIIKALRRLPDNADPMQVMWNVRVATEQALAHKNMRNVIAKTYGVKREMLVGKQAKMAGRSEEGKLVESLRDEHNWTTVNDLGEDYLFAPETAAEIRKLMRMMEPQHTKEIVKRYDKVIRAWKTAVTVYNPGYYTRNGIGEYMMGMFDGLTDPRWYHKGAKVLSFAKPDHMEEVLKSLEPWKKHQTIAQKGAQIAVKMRRGKDLTYEDVWVLYHDTGLKSGFISSEFDHYFPSMGSAKATGVGQKLTGANDKIRNAGEHYEDFFRLSHFMYRLAKSGHSDALKAAEEAATFVRKYHFDYTDFTPFEKTAMIRLFPFYKWTRKSLPLMASMVFTQPGKVMLYPKTMQAMSYATGGTDIASDDNGFAPNFEEVTPKWMRGMMAYPMGRDEDNAMTYMNVATPQMDIMKMLANPVGTTTGMLTPGLKVPLEQATGHPLDPEFSDMKFEGSYDRAQALARTTPFGSMMRNIITNNEPDQDSAVNEHGRIDEKLLSFLTGLGFYENNKQRQQGEQFRINMGGKP